MLRKGLLLALSTLTLTLTSCSREMMPTSPEPSSVADLQVAAPFALLNTSVVVRGYTVRYDGRTVASGKTTFTYTVTGTGCDPTLSNFVIQLPSCAPAVAYSSPSGAKIGIDPITCWYGIKWSQSLGSDATRTYSVKFPGDVPEGMVRVAVKAGHQLGTAVLPGPCGGFTIEGAVFIDTDGDGARDPVDEPGILPGVTVTLIDGDGSESVATDANGRYSFRRLDGKYTLRIDASTAADDFNEELAQSFTATGPTSVDVTLGPDAVVDFGFKPQTQELVTEIEEGVLESNGLPARFWLRVFKEAERGRHCDGHNPATLMALLTQIEGAFFTDPFQFTDGQEFKQVIAVLKSKPKDPLLELRKELLVAELNHFSGRGIIGHPELMEVLVQYGESIIVDATGSPTSAARVSGPTIARLTPGEIAGATELYRAINNARGGGDDPQ